MTEWRKPVGKIFDFLCNVACDIESKIEYEKASKRSSSYKVNIRSIIDDEPQSSMKETLNEAVRECKDIEVEENIVTKTFDKIGNVHDTIENARKGLNPVEMGKNLLFKSVSKLDIKLADSLYIQALGYTHHAIYVGDGSVIHYAGEFTEQALEVQLASLDEFTNGKQIFRRTEEECPLYHSPEEAINRAYVRLGEIEYNLMFNNCDSFVHWCRNGCK